MQKGDFQVKKISVLVLAVLLMFSFAAGALADQDSIDGLLVRSAEEFLKDVPNCSDLWIKDDCYIYGYDDCGRAYNGRGNDAIWALFKEYAQTLADSEFYEENYHYREEDFECWGLSYTGPGEFSHPLDMDEVMSGSYAIAIVSRKGDAQVWYSRDVATTNLEETVNRLDLFPKATPTPAPTATPRPNNGSGNCSVCDGDGKCNNCGGDMWFEGYKWVWDSRRREYNNEYVRELCHEDNCFAGGCKACDGDGWI